MRNLMAGILLFCGAAAYVARGAEVTTFYVAATNVVDGTHFKTVTAALDAVQKKSPGTCVVRLASGVYREKIVVSTACRGLKIVAEERGKAVISWDDYAAKSGPGGAELGTFRSYTMCVDADDFEMDGVTVVNTASDADVEAGGRGVGQAVALHVSGDRCLFRNCTIKSYQDTLYLTQEQFIDSSIRRFVDSEGEAKDKRRVSRQYFERCRIEGACDFIFGHSTALFNDCDLYLRQRGYVTAAATPKEQPFGFVFVNCRITGKRGEKPSMLGRPWREFAQTVFVDCEMDESIAPEGWRTWRPGDGRDRTAYYADFGTTGKGANNAKRVSWSHTDEADKESYFSTRGVNDILADMLKGTDGWSLESELAAN